MARILLINDEPDLLYLCQLVLEAAGHTVDTLLGGTGALDAARQFRPDLIGLDWIIPDMSGEELLHLLKSSPETSSVPILVISALEGLDSHVRPLGAERVLPKPFRPEDLRAAVSEVLAATIGHQTLRGG